MTPTELAPRFFIAVAVILVFCKAVAWLLGRAGQPAVVSYWMNRLQGHRSPETFLVTLNDRERLDPGSIVATMEYEHPIYAPEAVRAQSRLGGLATDRTVYAGAYHGWGFHEDGCRSGVEAARHFGVTW